MPKKNSKARSGLKKLQKAVDFPAEIFSGGAHLQLIGNRTLTVDGCCGIIEYSPCLVRLNIGDRCICITGSGLEVYDYNGGMLNIKGNILNIEYC